ncbi:MAG TPA: hypothetical protein VFB58_10825 [Chloroflexota bacterium]|nr:hypothetical protein [Chloroflexota bacterium]
MHRLLTAFAVLTLAAMVPLMAQAARMGHATLHSPLHSMGFPKAMASATLEYSKHDTVITFHASHLPAPSVLHEKVYILWATDGGMKDKVGVVTLKNGTGSLMGSVMMTKIIDLVVTAGRSASAVSGKTVLSGMVGR